MKSHNISTFFILFSFFFLILPLQASKTTVTIDPNQLFQIIEGWGVSLIWWANISGGWSKSHIDNVTYKAAIDLNMNIFRFNIGGGENPNCPYGHHMGTDGREMPGYRLPHADHEGWGTYQLSNDSHQINIMDALAAKRNDIITEIFSYSPPWWMTKSKCTSGNNDGSDNIDANFIDDYADYLTTVTSALNKRNPDWKIQYIEPFNEPLSKWWKAGGGQEGCYIEPETQASLLNYIKKSQKTYGINDIKLTAPDCNTVAETQYNIWYLWNNFNNEYNDLSKINVHTYDGTWQEKQSLRDDAKNGGKILWQSETGPLNWSPDDGTSWWKSHYLIAYRQIEDLRNLACTAWCDWQFISLDEGWGLLKLQNYDPMDPHKDPLYVETKGYYCRKQINSFIKRGYQIIDSSDGNSIAAINPEKNEIVIVIANKENTEKEYVIDLSKFENIFGFKTYRTAGDYSNNENCVEKLVESVSEKGLLAGKQIAYLSPQYSVSTFVVTIKGFINNELAEKSKENGNYI